MRAGTTIQDTQGISTTLPLFNGIPEERVGTVLKCLNARTTTCKRGETVVRQEEQLHFAHYLIEGEALGIRYDRWGDRSIINEYPTGSIIGSNVLYDNSEVISFSIVAKTCCTILNLQIDAEVRGCKTCMKYASIVRENATRALIEMNARLVRQLDTLSNRSTRDKLLSYLSEQAEQTGSNNFAIPFNRQELADYLYLERTALSRELGKMRKEGLISFSRNQFTLL